MRPTPRLGMVLAGLASTLATVVVGVLGVGVPAARAVSNTLPLSLAACLGGTVTPACEQGALSDFARARAKEHLAPMVLPSGFARLSAARQLFVLTDIDRVDHGLRPIAALDRGLDAIATAGARNGGDPAFPSGSYDGGSNFADVLGSTLYSEFEWVYDDGFGSSNIDCTVRLGAGCWGHRHNVLGTYPAPARMGAGASGTRLAEIMMGPAPKRYRPAEWTWAKASRLIPLGVTTRSLSGSGTVGVYASGLPATVTATTSGHWRVSRTRFRLAAGHERTVRVTGSGAGVLRLKGPNGTVSVRLG
jgi:hypothetical protein